MAGPGALKSGIVAWASGLRFPVLLGIVGALFVADLIVPDFVPFADEILLGLTTALLARWKKRREPENGVAD